MTRSPCLIYDDPRPIAAIWFDHGQGYRVSEASDYACSRIVAYREHGQGDFVPWLAVYQGEHLESRVPAHMVTIVYAEPTAPEAS